MMIRLFFFIASFLVLGDSLKAQNGINVFAEDGEKFYLYVNGEQINQTPESSVTHYDVENGLAALRIVLADESAPDIKKNISFLEPNVLVTSKLVMTKKGYKVKYFGERPLEITEGLDEEEEYAVPTEVFYEAEIAESSAAYGQVTETVTTTTEVAGGGATEESVEMHVGINGLEMNIDINVDDGISGLESTSTTTTTTMTSSSYQVPVETYTEEVVHTSSSGEGCQPPASNISTIETAMTNESFADDRMRVAKQAIKEACLKTVDVIRLAELFDFEDDRLEFAKYAYARTSDPENFFQVNEVFEFSDSKEAMDAFLQQQ